MAQNQFRAFLQKNHPFGGRRDSLFANQAIISETLPDPKNWEELESYIRANNRDASAELLTAAKQVWLLFAYSKKQDRKKERTEKLLTKVQIVQGFITILGLLIGGIVAADLYFGQRESWPHINISMDAITIDLNVSQVDPADRDKNNGDVRLVSIVAQLDNVGKVRAKVGLADLFVERVDPPIQACEVTGATNQLRDSLKRSISTDLVKNEPIHPWCTIRTVRQE